MPVDIASLFAAADLRDPLIPLWAMELLASGFFYVWLFCLGATVGSFLNVVIYRLPRKKNLAHPGSYCPRCGHPIRLSDNIPILSWLWLGGRCRDCRGAISPRYFAVELTVASTFVLVLAAEHFLPPGSLGFPTRRRLTPLDTWPFWSMYLMHLVLVTTLIAAILIRADGFPVPVRLYFPTLAVSCFVPLLWPEIRSMPALANGALAPWQTATIDGLAGLCAGFAMGLGGYLAIHRSRGLAPIALGCSLGVVLGWQRAMIWSLPILLVAAMASYSLARFARSDLPNEPVPASDHIASPAADATSMASSNSSTHQMSPPLPPEGPDPP